VVIHLIPIKDLRNIIGALRRVFARSEIRKAILAKAVDHTKVGPRKGRLYICNKCKDSFPSNQVNVDHIVPVVPIGMTASDIPIDIIAKNMWCDSDNLQVLCKECHHKKSLLENAMRRAHKRMMKEATNNNVSKTKTKK